MTNRMDFTHPETLALINSVKKYPVLWNTKIVGFHDRKAKAIAWKAVATEAQVHPEICKRKMESLNASYRREKSKIIKSLQSENVEDHVKPKWCYWNALKFMRGIADDQEDPLGTAPEREVEEVTLSSLWTTSKMLANKQTKPAKSRGSKDAPKTSMSRMAEQSLGEISEPETVQAVQNVRQEDEYTAIGITVEAKLRKMNYEQRLFAENIINQALYKGLMFQLTEHSEIRNSEFPPDYEPRGAKRKATEPLFSHQKTHSVYVTETNEMLDMENIKMLKSDSTDSDD